MTDMMISIHTFLAEGDADWEGWTDEPDKISIHTFLAEGDFAVCAVGGDDEYFNPHLPCGR